MFVRGDSVACAFATDVFPFSIFTKSDCMLVVFLPPVYENRWHFIAVAAELESGADWRAVELHPLTSSAVHGALLRRPSAGVESRHAFGQAFRLS
jgi:hypothetical protein